MNFPWYVDALFFVGIVGLLVRLAFILRERSPEKLAERVEAKQTARRFAQHEYFVQQVTGYFGSVVVSCVTAEDDRWPSRMIFASRHPDIERLRALKRLDRVGFDYVLRPVPRVGLRETCAYLRLRAG